MTRARSQLVSLDATPYYHCISRCVRRAFLCGSDRYSGKSFDHRKPWLVERLALLTNVFAIDIAAYAVMSNHYHLVVHVDKARADTWSDEEVIKRWTLLYRGPALVQRWKAGEMFTIEEQEQLRALVQKLKGTLCSISRFMACMNEYIARKANIEDSCTGRFWEGRFKSQALLDETALVSCMAYVDLNPVRAGLSDSLEKSDYTSIQDRVGKVQKQLNKQSKTRQKKPFRKPRLMPFSENLRQHDTFAAIPFQLRDYLELTDWTGRTLRPGKKGFIGNTTPTLISKLGISDTQWRILALDIQNQSITMLNGLDVLLALEKKATHIKAA